MITEKRIAHTHTHTHTHRVIKNNNKTHNNKHQQHKTKLTKTNKQTNNNEPNPNQSKPNKKMRTHSDNIEMKLTHSAELFPFEHNASVLR